MNAGTFARHGRQPVRLTPQQIYKFKQQAPAVPERIAALLNIARANLVFIPRVTADNKPCDPLLDKYLQLKSELAAAIDADDKGTPCRQLDAAIFSFQSGESETLVEGWVRMWLKNESERVAAEMLQAAHAQQERTVKCPVCGKWARPEGERYYHIEEKSLATGERVGSRQVFCVAQQAEFVSPIPDPKRINAAADADLKLIETFGMLADAALASKQIDDDDMAAPYQDAYDNYVAR